MSASSSYHKLALFKATIATARLPVKTTLGTREMKWGLTIG